MNRHIRILAGLTALGVAGFALSLYAYNCALHPNMKGAVEVKK